METDHLPGHNIRQKRKPFSLHLIHLQNRGEMGTAGDELFQAIG
jgi:hypothetical protein